MPADYISYKDLLTKPTATTQGGETSAKTKTKEAENDDDDDETYDDEDEDDDDDDDDEDGDEEDTSEEANESLDSKGRSTAQNKHIVDNDDEQLINNYSKT